MSKAGHSLTLYSHAQTQQDKCLSEKAAVWIDQYLAQSRDVGNARLNPIPSGWDSNIRTVPAKIKRLVQRYLEPVEGLPTVMAWLTDADSSLSFNAHEVLHPWEQAGVRELLHNFSEALSRCLLAGENAHAIQLFVGHQILTKLPYPQSECKR